MQNLYERISEIGLVPVIKIDDVETAIPLAQALCDGGLPCAEITFRTAQAAEAIDKMSKAFPEMLIGAGTVLTTEQVDSAVAAGASFIVSPGLNPKVVSYCLEKKIPIIPGTATPSDMERAIELGLHTVKFFPAEANGGLASIKAMAAPYTQMKFMPTGGINAKNLNDYLAFDRIIACGGSWMVPDKMLKEGNYDGIRALTREAVYTMLGLQFEIVSPDAYILRTGNVKRALRYLKAQGIAFAEESVVIASNGQIQSIEFEKPWNGARVTLIKK